ncbi:hypothetical protein Tco_0894214 [Tanacetum coccineum]|uniref:Uncharacterized protein n=1 Tax=Tanacetum coccineum TaxID=301880 RepID=A0ABQ5CCL9_9ASTR
MCATTRSCDSSSALRGISWDCGFWSLPLAGTVKAILAGVEKNSSNTWLKHKIPFFLDGVSKRCGGVRLNES